MIGKKCRICLKPNNLIKPCFCRKEFSCVHIQCLKEWLEMTGHRFCDICGFRYITIKRFKSRMEWFSDNTEEFETFMEILAKTVNILHCFFLAIALILIVNRITISNQILVIILCVRIYNIINIWIKFISNLNKHYGQWKKSNFSIQLFANPNRKQSVL